VSHVGEDFCAEDREVLACDGIHTGEEVFWGMEGGVEKDACGVVEASFCREDTICTCGGEASLCVAWVEEIPVCENHSVAREMLAEIADGSPVGKSGVVAFLLPCAPVHGEDACAGGEHHACIFKGLFFVWENADFGCDGHGEGG